MAYTARSGAKIFQHFRLKKSAIPHRYRIKLRRKQNERRYLAGIKHIQAAKKTLIHEKK